MGKRKQKQLEGDDTMTTSTKNFVYNIQNPIQGKKEPTITKKMLNDFRTEIAKYLPKDK